MSDLRQSTASQEISLGQFLDSTDGDTEEDGLTIANTDIKIRKHGTTTLANKNSGGATNISNGVYHATLDATDTDTAGMLEIYVHVAGALAVKTTFNVLTATAFDAKYTGTYNNISTAEVNAECDTAISDAALATAANLATVDTNVDSILVDTAEIGTAGVGLTDLGGMSTGMKAEVNAEADTALTDYDGPTNAEMVARTILAASYFDPAADAVANVTTVATTTTNTDMRGTDSALLASSAPTNFSDMSISVTTGLVDITQTAADKSWSTTTRALTDKANFTVDVLKINGVTIIGAGTSGNLWRA